MKTNFRYKYQQENVHADFKIVQACYDCELYVPSCIKFKEDDFFDYLQIRTAVLYTKTVVLGLDLDMMITGAETINKTKVIVRTAKIY